jgi:Transglycosylase-like domain
MIGSLSNFRRLSPLRAHLFRFGFAALSVGILTTTGPAVARASAQAKPAGTIPVAAPAASVPSTPRIAMPGSVGVTSQIVESDKLATLVAATAPNPPTNPPLNPPTTPQGPPPTNSPGVVVTPTPTPASASSTEASAETTLPSSPTPSSLPSAPAKKTTKRKKTTKAPAPTETTEGPTEVANAEAQKPEAGKPTQSQESILAALRKCESGGNYKANTGNGYYGAYQFALGTWKKLGYSGYPHEAAPAVQDEAVLKLAAKAGWGQWPACSRKIGLR